MSKWAGSYFIAFVILLLLSYPLRPYEFKLLAGANVSLNMKCLFVVFIHTSHLSHNNRYSFFSFFLHLSFLTWLSLSTKLGCVCNEIFLHFSHYSYWISQTFFFVSGAFLPSVYFFFCCSLVFYLIFVWLAAVCDMCVVLVFLFLFFILFFFNRFQIGCWFKSYK